MVDLNCNLECDWLIELSVRYTELIVAETKANLHLISTEKHEQVVMVNKCNFMNVYYMRNEEMTRQET